MSELWKVQRGTMNFGASEDSEAVSFPESVVAANVVVRLTNTANGSGGEAAGATDNMNDAELLARPDAFTSSQFTINRHTNGENVDVAIDWEALEGPWDVVDVRTHILVEAVTSITLDLTGLYTDINQLTPWLLGTDSDEGAGYHADRSCVRVTITSLVTDAQDETSYDNSPTTEGIFDGGSGHAALDVITVTDGTKYTVDAVSSGVVTEFTVDSSTDTGQHNIADVLSQTGTTGSGTGFNVTLDSDNIKPQLELYKENLFEDIQAEVAVLEWDSGYTIQGPITVAMSFLDALQTETINSVGVKSNAFVIGSWETDGGTVTNRTNAIHLADHDKVGFYLNRFATVFNAVATAYVIENAARLNVQHLDSIVGGEADILDNGSPDSTNFTNFTAVADMALTFLIMTGGSYARDARGGHSHLNYRLTAIQNIARFRTESDAFQDEGDINWALQIVEVTNPSADARRIFIT